MLREALVVLAAASAVPCAAAAAPAVTGGSAVSPVAPRGWHLIGPFEAGSREGLVHPLADSGGRIPERFPLDETRPSALVDGGRVGWKPVQPDESGGLALRLEGVRWEARQEELGRAALLNTACLQASFELEAPGQLLVQATRCNVRINGRFHAGDPYGSSARSVAEGRAGTNSVVVTSTGYGPERSVGLALRRIGPSERLMIVEEDVLLPDAVAWAAGGAPAAVPLLNLTDEWVSDVSIAIRGAHVSGRAEIPFPLAPRALLRVPVPMAWTPAAAGDQHVAITADGAPPASAVMSVRAPAEPRRETFLSAIDASAQPYGLRPALDASGRGLVLTLHGAGVECRGQAAAHRPLAWAAFVAPQGRRPYGFDWHDWAEQDALEVLELAAGRLGTDRDRVVLTGQSMGGHGAWVLGAHRPDLFCALTASAGWIGYDSLLPFTLRRSTHEAPAELQSLMLQSLAPGRVGGLMDNLEGLPVRVFHGQEDDNIPAWHARWLVAALERRGLDATLREGVGKRHWSELDVDPALPSEGCADAAALHASWESARRDAWPRRVVIVTSDPDVGGRRSWIRLVRQIRVARESRLDVVVESPSLVRVATRNVASFSFAPAPALGLAEAVVVDVDGQAVRCRAGFPVTLEKRAERWRIGKAAPEAGAFRPGGMAKALFRPFLVVAGTRTRTERSLEAARSLAQAWWIRAGGLAPIVRDTDLDDDLRSRYSLVLIGGPDVNAESARLGRQLAVIVDADGATVAGRRVAGRSLAAAHWQPSPRFPDRRILVLQGADDLADELLAELHPVAPGAGLPDFLVASPAVRRHGWGGLRAAGFWDPGFGYDPAGSWGLD